MQLAEGDLAIRVISLVDALERRKHMKRLLGDLGLEFEFFDAVKGAGVGSELCERLQIPEGLALSSAEIGCLASHVSIWRKLAARGTGWVLVLEDDLHLSRDLPLLLEEFRSSPPPSGIIRLETVNSSQILSRSPAWAGTKYQLLCSSFKVSGTGAYLIDATTARLLCSHTKRLKHAIDIELFHRQRSNLPEVPVLQCYPAPAIQDIILPKELRTAALGTGIGAARADLLHGIDQRDFGSSMLSRFNGELKNRGRPFYCWAVSVIWFPKGVKKALVPFG